MHDGKSSILKIGFIFVACKQKQNQFVLPVFSVFVGLNANQEMRRYVDTQGRTYSSWNAWENENSLPMLKYAYPSRGYFTCSPDGSYEFDLARNPHIKYATSPRCKISKRVLNQADVVSGITSLGA